MVIEKRRRVRLMVACAVGALSSTAAIHVHAQTSAQSTTIGEVVVTARKRQESLQKIPVAITTQTGAQLEQQRVVQVKELGKLVPSLQIRDGSGSGSSAQIFMRGQGASDTLLGISQPIGLYEDTVNIPHVFGSNNGFFDLARVEVLKGPQGTLYGRNTTGGAINILTRGADYNGYHGFAEAEFGNYNDVKISAAVNVPIVPDVLAVRVAYEHWNKDGFGHSIITHQTFGDDHDDDLARLSVKFDPIPNVDAVLKVEYGSAKTNGAMLANTSIGNSTSVYTANSAANNAFYSAALWQNYTANAPIVQGALFGSPAANAAAIAIGQGILAPCIGGSIYVNCSASNQFERIKTWHGALDIKWDITNNISLRSITGLHYFTDTKVFDLDSVQPQILEVGYAANGGEAVAPTVGTYSIPGGLKPDQESTQWSQEFDLSGKLFDDRLNWLVGGYASRDRGNGDQAAGALEEFTALASVAFTPPTFNALDTAHANPLLFAHDGLRNSSDTWGVYTQNDFRITKQFSITAGVRYTEEKIGQVLADWHYYNTPNTTYATASTYDNGAGGVGTYQGPLSYVCDGTKSTPGVGQGSNATTYAPPVPGDPSSCAYAQDSTGINDAFIKAKFSGLTYLASLNYQVTSDLLAYVKVSRGFRGGAFGRSAAFPAKPETDDDYEVGVKSDWLDHRLRLNLALYDTEYQNKQVSSLTCTTGEAPPCVNGFTTTIRNAATARIQGVELEGQGRPIAGLSIYGEASYTNAYYVKWLGAVTGDGVPLSTIQPTNTQSSAANIPLAVTPTWQGDVGARYEVPLEKGILGAQMDYAYRGAYPITAITHQLNVPASVEQWQNRGIGLINGSVDFKVPDSGFSVSIWGTNLTDVKYGYEGISAGYTGSIGHTVVQAPRSYGITLRKSFGAG